MPIRMEITPNAAMLFPRTETVNFAGKMFKILQLDVGTIAQIEDEVATILETPFDDEYQASLEFMERTQDDRENHRLERIKHFYKILEAQEHWPPNFQDPKFIQCLNGQLGRNVFLATQLRRSNGFISDEEIVELAKAMTLDEWELLDRISWGLPDWMAFGATGDSEPSTQPGRGLNWAEVSESLATKRGWSYDTISKMFVNQVINCINQGKPWDVWVNTPTDNLNATHAE